MKRLSNEGEVRTATLARAFHLTRVTLYHEPRPGSHRRLHADEPRARDRVRRVAFDHPSFGYRRVWSVLRGRERMFIHRKGVRRILKEEGLQKGVHSPRRRLPETGNPSALEPNQRWYADLTCVDTTDLGPVPLMVAMGACTRKFVGRSHPCGLTRPAADPQPCLLRAH